MIDAVADLFVAGEQYADRPVRNSRILEQPGRGFHDHGHARLVVGSQAAWYRRW